MASSDLKFDLQSLTNLQTQYLSTLTDFSGNNMVNIPQYTALQRNLNEMNSKVTGANKALAADLANLSSVDGILDSQLTDLNTKKQQVDGAHYAKMRELNFIESRRKRQSEITNMYYTLFIACIVFIGVILLSKFIDISSEIQTFLGVVIFGIALLLMVRKYLEIRKRDLGDHDQLNLEPPIFKDPSSDSSVIDASGQSLAGAAGGATCSQTACGEGTYWDVESSSCVAGSSDGFANITNSNSNVNDKYVYDVKPFELNKKSGYTSYA